MIGCHKDIECSFYVGVGVQEEYLLWEDVLDIFIDCVNEENYGNS